MWTEDLECREGYFVFFFLRFIIILGGEKFTFDWVAFEVNMSGSRSGMGMDWYWGGS
jgi:hypothetical protein